MTERGRKSVSTTKSEFHIGPSSLCWDGNELVVHIRERAAPLPRAVHGTIRLRPNYITDCSVALAPEAVHRWWPVAPAADVEVAFENPSIRWRGGGYLDTNSGDAMLEDHFAEWDWSRSESQGDNKILYDVSYRNGDTMCLGLSFDKIGHCEEFDAPGKVALGSPFWGVSRAIRSDAEARVRQTLEDSPFYTRSVVETSLAGEPTVCVHESLSLERFRLPIVKAMLPFRMPRRA